MGWFRRRKEATDQQLAATGAAGGYYDPVDRDLGYRSVGAGPREIPSRTLERARQYSIAGYRANPMARAIIDTYTSFCVGDSGLTLNCTSPDVRVVAEQFWNDSENYLGDQDLMLRSHLLNGESVYEMLVGQISGVTRRSVIDPIRIAQVDLFGGNPLWPAVVELRNYGGEPIRKTVIRRDDLSELRVGEVFFWRSFRALETDVRGAPFLMPVIDWLDNYDQVLSNLIDRTALARFIAFQVTLKGNKVDNTFIDNWIAERGGTHLPRSGSIEVTNENVEWTPLQAHAGAYEDKTTAGAIMTSIAGGSGLAKTWLAEPEDANRATSLTMAEPVRRRVGGVQNVWLGYQTEMVRFAVDQAVARKILPALVEVQTEGGQTQLVPAAQTVTITGPEVAAADAKVTAEVLVNLSEALGELVSADVLTLEAARVAAKKAWESFAGVPYTAELDKPDADTDKVADHVDSTQDAAAPGAGLLSA